MIVIIYVMATLHPAFDRVTRAVTASGARHGDLAAALSLSRPAFSDRMRGRTRWSLDEAVALSHLLGIPLVELVDAHPVIDGQAALL